MCGMLGGITGRRLALFITDRYKRPSFTVLALVGVLFLSSALLVYDIAVSETDFSIHNVCDDR
jgi:hypothetical protein